MIKKPNLKIILTVFYAIFFVVYLCVGLQPAAEAINYKVSSELIISDIDLTSPVAELTIDSGELKTPTELVGSYSTTKNKTLLIGHASGVFKNLHLVEIGDKITYDGQTYQVISSEVVAKESINMEKILANTKRPVLKIMTCAGDFFGDGDATHRLIVTAIKEESWKNYVSPY